MDPDLFFAVCCVLCAVCSLKVVEHDVHHHARHRNIKPQWEGPSGNGRVFHTAIGHNNGKDITAQRCVGFISTFQRGTEWAATGGVTQKVPADFPTADKTSLRE